MSRWKAVVRIEMHPKRTVVLTVLVLLLVDWVVFDRWGINGSVADATNGALIEGAWVFAVFNGEEPLINIPYGPDPRYRMDKCMGTRVTRTDSLGRFRFDAFTFNRPLAQKSAHIIVFKPGWIASTESSSIASSLWALSPKVRISMTRGPGERQSVRQYRPDDAQARLPTSEHSFSSELSGAARVVVRAMSRCGYQGLPMARAAMEHALDITTTFDERERIRASCRYAANAAMRFGRSWPFDCENLPFKKSVSSEVLAVEAEVVADRRMRLGDPPRYGQK